MPANGASNGWIYLSSSFQANTVLTLEASTNLQAWQNLGTFHDAVRAYPDLAAPGFGQRFYRLLSLKRGTTNDWKNQIFYPQDALCMTNEDMQMAWIKFAILTSDPFRVYYQDSRKFAFHYEYATQRLALFRGMTPEQFEAVSLWRTNQQVVLGSVIYPLGNSHSTMRKMMFPEYGVQFVGMDPCTPDEIARWFTLVKATVFASNNITAFYVPTFEQSEVARTNAAAFADRGIPVTTTERWIWMNNVYASGWALGPLKYFPSLEVDEAFADGRLRPEDILLTDGVAAHTPLVAGILTLTPATPNSHTALLSQSLGIPFAYLSEIGEQARVRQLVGRMVLFRASLDRGTGGYNPLTSLVTVFEVESLNPEFEAELLSLKRPPLHFPPKQPYGDISASTDGLTPEYTQFFGGKAANYGILRQSITNFCPQAIAFSFDLWDAFMDQVLPNAKTLRKEIAVRLAGFTNYPPDMVALQTALAAIRDLITQTASFTPEQQEAITNALAIFTPSRKIRFRSSTNVEDLDRFTGAGLYDSYSGCLLDDLDEDTEGPCRCDASEPKERGVFRAIQKVYASFYNDKAFLARLAHRVDETQVGMGLLVHHSFPDEDELANGVATLRCEYIHTPWGDEVKFIGELVTQLGAEPVTNPTGTATPEIIEVLYYDREVESPRQYSSLVPWGTSVMEWYDYADFLWLFDLITRRFYQLRPEQYVFNLDFEYKKVKIQGSRGMFIKQVRQLPDPGAINQGEFFLIDDPSTLRVAQKEYIGIGLDDVFSNHRLKSLWALHTANVQLTSSNLGQAFYTEATCQYVEDGVVRTLSGPINSWPNATYTYSAAGLTNSWTTGTGANQRIWRLVTAVPVVFSGPQAPIFTHADFPKILIATSLTTRDDGSTMTNTDKVSLELLPQAAEGALQQRTISKTNGPAIATSFYWPKESFPAGYTAPLLRFVETRIMGLTTTPIVLTNYFSQTYSPAHHNFADYFIFEPRLEPGLSSNILAELKAANIQFIYAIWDGLYNKVVALQAMGFDQKLRDL
jgi:hypothetical protein